MSAEYPHGQCECVAGCRTCGPDFGGPAAFEVTRNGQTIRVCTRCDLTSDTNRRLLATVDDPADPYRAWDALGFFCIAGMLSGAISVSRDQRPMLDA